MSKVEVDTADLLKIEDTLIACKTFLEGRDTMNASVHLAPVVRYSPLTVRVQAEAERLTNILSSA